MLTLKLSSVLQRGGRGAERGRQKEREREREYAAFTSTGLIMMTSPLLKTQRLQEWNFEEDN